MEPCLSARSNRGASTDDVHRDTTWPSPAPGPATATATSSPTSPARPAKTSATPRTNWCEIDLADQHQADDAPDSGLVSVRISPAAVSGRCSYGSTAWCWAISTSRCAGRAGARCSSISGSTRPPGLRSGAGRGCARARSSGRIPLVHHEGQQERPDRARVLGRDRLAWFAWRAGLLHGHGARRRAPAGLVTA